MNFDYNLYHYPSRRNVVFSNKGMVATSVPQAAKAGADMLKLGGNAVDAAIATAATLSVVEPSGNGVGGDAFAIVWIKDEIYGLNASGHSSENISAEKVKSLGHEKVPTFGWVPVTVPGTPSAWVALSKRFGKLPLKTVLGPAIEYAKNGFPLSVMVGRPWARAWEIYKNSLKDEELHKHWFEHFSIDGRAAQIGEVWKSEHLAKTLEDIAETAGESFYRGNIADKIINFSKKTGGFFSYEDFEKFQPEWVNPISVNYKGYDVWQIPPNGQGISALMALNILKGLELDKERDTLRNYHLQFEAIKLAGIDAREYVTDPNFMKVKAEELLSEAYADERRKLIGEKALTPTIGKPQGSGTVYLCTADSDGNMVSYIQSNYMGFGSGIVVPETGVSLHNRGNNFTLEEGHVNIIEPRKRPYHTIIPGFLSKNKKAIGPFGVMGGFLQPQAHVQMVLNMVDFNMNPQDALDAPRWQWMEGKKIDVEGFMPNHLFRQLREMGHQINVVDEPMHFGRGQIITRLENGVYCGGTEPRTDGSIYID